MGGPELDLLPPARPLTEATNSGLQAVQVERAFELSGSTEDRFFQSMPSSGASFPAQLSVEKWHRARRGAGGARGREQEISLGSRSPTHTAPGPAWPLQEDGGCVQRCAPRTQTRHEALPDPDGSPVSARSMPGPLQGDHRHTGSDGVRCVSPPPGLPSFCQGRERAGGSLAPPHMGSGANLYPGCGAH